MAASPAHLPILYMTQMPPPTCDLFPPQYATFLYLQWQWHSCPHHSYIPPESSSPYSPCVQSPSESSDSDVPLPDPVFYDANVEWR